MIYVYTYSTCSVLLKVVLINFILLGPISKSQSDGTSRIFARYVPFIYARCLTEDRLCLLCCRPCAEHCCLAGTHSAIWSYWFFLWQYSIPLLPTQLNGTNSKDIPSPRHFLASSCPRLKDNNCSKWRLIGVCGYRTASSIHQWSHRRKGYIYTEWCTLQRRLWILSSDLCTRKGLIHPVL